MIYNSVNKPYYSHNKANRANFYYLLVPECIISLILYNRLAKKKTIHGKRENYTVYLMHIYYLTL